jgi:uncharacterized protein (DUF1330 family)
MSAFLVSHVKVHNQELMASYIAGSVALATSLGARYLARTDQVTAADGTFGGGRVVIIEFPNWSALRSFWDSDEYQELRKLRLGAATGDVWILPGEGETVLNARAI